MEETPGAVGGGGRSAVKPHIVFEHTLTHRERMLSCPSCAATYERGPYGPRWVRLCLCCSTLWREDGQEATVEDFNRQASGR